MKIDSDHIFFYFYDFLTHRMPAFLYNFTVQFIIKVMDKSRKRLSVMDSESIFIHQPFHNVSMEIMFHAPQKKLQDKLEFEL